MLYRSYPPLSEQRAAVKKLISGVQGVASNLIWEKNALRGTYEATLVEAQGAQIIGLHFDPNKGGNHRQSLTNGNTNLQKHAAKLQHALAVLNGTHPHVHQRVSGALNPLITRKTWMFRLALSTLGKAVDLAVNHSDRLANHPPFPALRTRSEATLAHNQLYTAKQRYPDLNLEFALVPNLEADSSLLAEIRRLPPDFAHALGAIKPVFDRIELEEQSVAALASSASKEDLGMIIRPLRIIIDNAVGKPYTKGWSDSDLDTVLDESIDGKKLS